MLLSYAAAAGCLPDLSLLSVAVTCRPMQQLDEDLHSRQIAVYGRDTMHRLQQASVLVIGARGLGIEICEPPVEHVSM